MKDAQQDKAHEEFKEKLKDCYIGDEELKVCEYCGDTSQDRFCSHCYPYKDFTKENVIKIFKNYFTTDGLDREWYDFLNEIQSLKQPQDNAERIKIEALMILNEEMESNELKRKIKNRIVNIKL